MSLSDSLWAALRLWIPAPRWVAPPRRVSQVPGLICSRALLPATPESPDKCLLLASLPVSGFLRMGGLATLSLLTRPNRIRLRCGSRVRHCEASPVWISPPGTHRTTCRKSNYMVDSFHSTRSASLILAHPCVSMRFLILWEPPVAVGMAVTSHPPHRPVLAGTTAYGSYLGSTRPS